MNELSPILCGIALSNANRFRETLSKDIPADSIERLAAGNKGNTHKTPAVFIKQRGFSVIHMVLCALPRDAYAISTSTWQHALPSCSGMTQPSVSLPSTVSFQTPVRRTVIR